jgi:inositol 1,4,5-triphosphate receptor type 3
MHTFANLNPLKMSYYDVSGSEDFSGSNFWFEAVQDTEIREYNELMSMIAPLMILNRNPILLSLLRYHSNLAPQRNKVDMMIHKSPKK